MVATSMAYAHLDPKMKTKPKKPPSSESRVLNAKTAAAIEEARAGALRSHADAASLLASLNAAD